ncbi:MAG: hypothetical protein JWP29_1321 [Rhodoferax sp.]|nr:hypothetical protein [Rhodoferax sp.]
MSKYAIPYLTALIVLVVLDMLWLRVIAYDWYRQGMGEHMAEQPNLVAAALFYVLFPVGLVIFGAQLGQPDSGVLHAALMGALFGFFAYATYDLTNLAVMKNWPLGLSLLDMGWGTLVSAVAAAGAKFVSRL